MKMYTVVIALMVALAAAQAQTTCTPTILTYQQFKTRFNISYNNATQDAIRNGYYDINAANLANSTCCYCGVTKYFDRTSAQLSNLRGGVKSVFTSTELNIQNLRRQFWSTVDHKIVVNNQAPASLDWRNVSNVNKVTSVKDQGLTCPGAGAYFTAAAQSESRAIIAGGQQQTLDLSEQYLLQCAQENSCTSAALEYAVDKAIHGIPQNVDFPYNPSTSYPNICSSNQLISTANTERITIRDATNAQIKAMLERGPVAAVVSTHNWEQYKSGVISCPSNVNYDHAVLIVGYTPNYWIVKNSWGSDFGQAGYVHVEMNQNNNCQIHRAVSVVSTLAEKYAMLSFIMMLVIIMIAF